jgi:hypothetical protein
MVCTPTVFLKEIPFFLVGRLTAFFRPSLLELAVDEVLPVAEGLGDRPGVPTLGRPEGDLELEAEVFLLGVVGDVTTPFLLWVAFPTGPFSSSVVWSSSL